MVATYLEDKKYGLDYPFVFDLAIVSLGRVVLQLKGKWQ